MRSPDTVFFDMNVRNYFINVYESHMSVYKICWFMQNVQNKRRVIFRDGYLTRLQI